MNKSDAVSSAKQYAADNGQTSQTALPTKAAGSPPPAIDTIQRSSAKTQEASAHRLGDVRNVASRPALSAQSPQIATLFRYYDTWMGTDKKRILSFYANPDDPNGLQDHGSGTQMSFRAFADAFTTGFPGMRHEVTGLQRIDDHNIEVTFDFKAKQTGAFLGIPASGNDVNVPCKGVYTFDDQGKVTHLDLTYDGADFMAQLKKGAQ